MHDVQEQISSIDEQFLSYSLTIAVTFHAGHSEVKIRKILMQLFLLKCRHNFTSGECRDFANVLKMLLLLYLLYSDA